MRSVFALLAAALLLLAIPAHADERSRTGFYAGGHAGMAISSTEVSVPGIASIDGLAGNGFSFGARLGFDYHVPGTSFVLGIGGTYDRPDGDFSVSITGMPTLLRAGIDKSWSAYGRAGYVTGRAMPYVLVGWNEADASASILGTKIGTTTLKGLLVGGGFEYDIGNGLFLGAEGRYSKFDTDKSIPGLNLDTQWYQVMGTLTYKFNPF